MDRNTPILHVEDDPIDVANLRRAFSRCGIPNPLRAAPDAKAALAVLRQRPSGGAAPAGLVLLDLSLPGAGGLELLGELKADPRLRAIPVVVLTASVLDSDRRRAWELGAAGYVVKPIDVEAFVRAVQVIERYWALCELGPP